MKVLFCTLVFLSTVQMTIVAQCPSGNYTVTGNALITSSCTINGDLVILNSATLNVDFTTSRADSFVVRGNVILKGNAVLWVHASEGSTNDQFIISNSFSEQRSVTTLDSSILKLENIEFRTQEGNLSNAASIYMSYWAEGKSIFYVHKTRLDPTKAWLLFNMKNKSTLIGNETEHVPAEVYVQDTAQVSLRGQKTNIGIWLNCENVRGTFNLPANQNMPFSWKLGRGVGGINTPWYLEMDTVRAGVGVQIFPTSNITINGSGFPITGELKVALLFANGTDTISNLAVGIQNKTISNGINGKIKLNNVNLGPIAWQIYALMNENLFIKNSTINEIGIAGPSVVTVDSSVLQLAVLASFGVGGSTLSIRNSEIWNQSITASNNSLIILNDCNVFGSAFSCTDATSRISVNNSCFFKNPTGCSQATMVNIATGRPNCNPFIPPGFPQILTPLKVGLSRVNYNCLSSASDISNAQDEAIFSPNPSSNSVQVKLSNAHQDFTVEVYSLQGQLILKTTSPTNIDISNFRSGIYVFTLKQGNNRWSTKITKK